MFALLFFIALTSASDFNTWCAKHNKHFTAVEALRRRAIFNKNAKFVQKFNSEHTYKLSLDGPFAAMTHAEYTRLLKPIILDTKGEETMEIKKQAPTSVDWREEGKLPAVRDQGSCGSCYTFAALAAVEGRLLIAGSSFTKSNLDLSEQQLVDCSTEQGNMGCDGGSLVYTFRHLKLYGSMKESDYKYTEKQGTCSYVESKVVVTIGGQKMVTSGSESALATAVAEGPVAVAIDASLIAFQLYSSGIFDNESCSSTTLNHGVAAVGYGTESGTDYWIVRNSWGSSWGEDGYIRMVRNKNNQCGIAAGAAYPTGVAAVGYGTESGTDYWIVRNSWGSSWGEDGYIRMVRNKNNQCGIAAGAAYPTGVADA